MTLFKHQAAVVALRQALSTIIVGQPRLLDRLIIGLLAGGHILVEGLPGLAKTTAVKALAGSLQAQFRRIQFTPDLLPGERTGTLRPRPSILNSSFSVHTPGSGRSNLVDDSNQRIRI